MFSLKPKAQFQIKAPFKASISVPKLELKIQNYIPVLKVELVPNIELQY